MASPPLLASGTGKWWYGIPEEFGYPSRSFHYTQASQTLSGALVLGQPDGSVLREEVAAGSTLLMTHEFDATPEDLPLGLGLAEAGQLHPRYPQYYPGGMPWELIFFNLENGAQLMLAVMAFHDIDRGTLGPVLGRRPTPYYVLATVRLPSGESITLDEKVRVEHIAYRTIVGKVPTFMVQTLGVWTQSSKFRISYGGSSEGPGVRPRRRAPVRSRPPRCRRPGQPARTAGAVRRRRLLRRPARQRLRMVRGDRQLVRLREERSVVHRRQLPTGCGSPANPLTPKRPTAKAVATAQVRDRGLPGERHHADVRVRGQVRRRRWWIRRNARRLERHDHPSRRQPTRSRGEELRRHRDVSVRHGPTG